MSSLIDESILKNPFLLAIMPAVIVACINYLAANNTKVGSIKATYYEKRFLNFYFPVFKRIELQLFKEISYDEALDINKYLTKMIDDHYMLVNDRIIDRHYLMTRNLESLKLNFDSKKPQYLKDFKSICNHIDEDITFLQNKLDLPTRGLIYRVNHRQLTISSLFYGRVLSELLDELVIPYCLFFALIFFTYHFNLLGK